MKTTAPKILQGGNTWTNDYELFSNNSNVLALIEIRIIVNAR